MSVFLCLYFVEGEQREGQCQRQEQQIRRFHQRVLEDERKQIVNSKQSFGPQEMNCMYLQLTKTS